MPSSPPRSGDPQISLSSGGQISERALHFLKALIERHIRDGQPVGSRTLARDAGLDLSPATVRNVMSDLEDLGLVSSPHTSAGRVPTVSGYRLFVDTLLTVSPMDDALLTEMRSGFAPGAESKALIESASRLLSGVTHLAGVVMVPRHEREMFHQIEFLKLSGTRVLTILVTADGEVHNRIIHTEHEYSPSQLQQASNYLTELFSGLDMREVRKRLLEDLKQTHRRMDELMMRAMAMAQSLVAAAEPRDDVMIAGQTNLLEFAELANMERLKPLFQAFTEKRQILDLLDRCIEADGVQIFIGQESGFELLDDCSLVTTTYRVEDRILGVLGVIGPTRMDYQRVIPIVDVTAKLLAAALRQP
ncbi:heat-inducible transcriptional repressor HrcA [Thiohalocapsa sp. ML1]|jgi:heat-inducible transcriptional repressor|uniref:heat-inducible transcriptional repressor HrcA n=1 Tax=Thiohalocapsa sp. ML1 TaxID=1431688 RepID=UPI000731FE31|nr:heat-inducible transcriptional repressor HrcA [Thiohalocapsa sp. ML1]